MSRRILGLVAVALVVGLMAPAAFACWDNSDAMVVKLQKLKLSTEQLKDIVILQKEHKQVVVRAHKEGLGCRYHENHDAVFAKQAVGVLTDVQFRSHTGRKRNQVEGLTYENRVLRKKIEKLEKQLKQLQELMKKLALQAKSK